MKNVLKGLLVTLISFVLINANVNAIEKPEVTDHEKINVYIFRGNGCGHCHNAVTYFYGLGDEFKDYFNVVLYEVWYNEANASLGKAVATELGKTFSGVPFIVVGDTSFGGFGEGTGLEIIEEALESYQDDKYKDIVAKVQKSKKFDIKEETIEEAAYNEGITDVEPTIIEEESSNDTVVVIVIFLVFIGGFGALIYSSRKK
ncbi:MAG: hypothetical protein IJA94_02625 [Bacilli bacterium]|nr:hypothetical protein [Bacilli bacterium]